jgi:hypothetical protein
VKEDSLRQRRLAGRFDFSVSGEESIWEMEQVAAGEME